MDWNKVLEFISNLWNNIFIKVLVSTLVFILLWWLSTMIVNKTKKRALSRSFGRKPDRHLGYRNSRTFGKSYRLL